MSALVAHRGLLGVSAAVFAASAATTVIWCGAMSTMPGMDMPGGWTMSMAWMRMPGQTWSGAAATFLGMWTVMMVAMMLPVLVPMLMRYRRAASATPHARRLTTSISAGYFAVWTALGIVAYPVGVALAELAMQVPAFARAVPLSVGLMVLFAGALQFTPWKARRLACCRVAPRALPADTKTAFRHGLRLGIRCVRCCAGLTMVLLVSGVMDLRAMAFLTLAIIAERLAPAGRHVARGIGAIVAAFALCMVARAISA